nr:MAG TPA: hypothetical protein [Caudoviricetes sp.]
MLDISLYLISGFSDLPRKPDVTVFLNLIQNSLNFSGNSKQISSKSEFILFLLCF